MTELPEAPEPPTGSRKRKFNLEPNSAAKLMPAKEHLYGKLSSRDLVQKLGSVGIQDVKLVERSPGNFMIHLVSNSLTN